MKKRKKGKKGEKKATTRSARLQNEVIIFTMYKIINHTSLNVDHS
jgi:hypothetical protein